MSDSPSWVHKMDGRQRPRSQSVQPGSASYWDARSPYQPLKWQAEYNHGSTGSPGPSTPINLSPGPSSRSPMPHSGSRASLLPKKGSGVNLDTIPEDHFLDRGTDFRFVGGIRNPVFEMSDFSQPNRNRRHSEGDVLDRGHQRHFNRNDNPPYRQPNLGPISNEFGMDDTRRKSLMHRDIRSDMRNETKSEVSVGGRSIQSARSGRSESIISDKSEDTKLTSVTSSRNDRRRSEAGSKSSERRPSTVPSRRSAESNRSSTSSGNNSKNEPSVLTAAPVEIPIEFLETPATRVKKLFGPVIMCVLVITLAGSLGAAIYFATVLKEAQEQTIDLLKAQLEMSTSGVNIQKLTLSQKQALTDDYCKQMDEFYKQSTLFEKTYKKCRVDRLTNSNIKFTLFFEDEEDEATPENIVEVLKAQATDSGDSKQVEIKQLKLDLDTVTVKLEKVKPEKVTEKTTMKPATPPPVEHLPQAVPVTFKPVTTASTTTISPTTSKSTTHGIKLKETTSARSTTKITTRPTTARRTQELQSVESQVNVCIGKSGDYFPHHRECNLYIQCHDGESVTFACPQGTVFDINQKVCVTKTDDVICPEKPISAGYDWSARDPWDPCRNSKGNQYFPYPEDCNLYFQCQHNKSIVRLCPKDSIFDTVNNNCMPASPDIICYTISTVATETATDEDDALVVTQNAETRSTTTMPPIVYPSRPEYSATPCAEGVNGGLYPHPANCSQYILCEYTNERIQACAYGLYFDPNINTCVQPKNDLLCPDIRPCEGLVKGLFPHPKDCTKFISCNNEQEVIQKCMPQFVWNPRSNSCVLINDSVTCPDGSR